VRDLTDEDAQLFCDFTKNIADTLNVQDWKDLPGLAAALDVFLWNVMPGFQLERNKKNRFVQRQPKGRGGIRCPALYACSARP
jgi:hypothetical protein